MGPRQGVFMGSQAFSAEDRVSKKFTLTVSLKHAFAASLKATTSFATLTYSLLGTLSASDTLFIRDKLDIFLCMIKLKHLCLAM